MVAASSRSLVSSGKDLITQARSIVSGMLTRIQDAIDTALDDGLGDDGESLSQADIVGATMNDLIESMPDLLADGAVTTAVEGAVYDVIQQ